MEEFRNLIAQWFWGTNNTDHNDSDTDDDGMIDGWEHEFGLVPLDSNDADTDLTGALWWPQECFCDLRKLTGESTKISLPS